MSLPNYPIQNKACVFMIVSFAKQYPDETIKSSNCLPRKWQFAHDRFIAIKKQIIKMKPSWLTKSQFDSNK